MSDTAASSPAPIPRHNHRFVKGGPGGPGRPRGSVNRDLVREEIRSEAARTRTFIAACLESSGLERRLAALEARLEDGPRGPRPFRSPFSDRLRRFFVRHDRQKSPQTKAPAVLPFSRTD